MSLKIDQDHHRFRQIVRGKIRQNLRRYISHGEIMGRKGKDLVSIPIPQIDIPRFRFGDKQQGGVGQGDGDAGDPMGGQEGEGEGGKGKAGKDAGEHALEVDVSLDELAEILGEELALPDIQNRGKSRLQNTKDRYVGIRRVGPDSLLHFKRTYREALKRMIASKTFTGGSTSIVPIPEDKRFRSWKTQTEPAANAVILYMMDVSGCCMEGQYIEMADGSYKDVKNVAVGDQVCCVDVAARKKTTSVVTETFHYWVHETVQLTTEDHDTLRVTPNHRYFVYDEPEDRIIEKRAHELKAGDQLILINRHGDATEGEATITRGEAYLVGAMLGDGHIYHSDEHYSRSLAITDESRERLERYAQVFAQEYGVQGILREPTDDPNSRRRLLVNSVELVRRYEEHFPMLRRRSPQRYIDPVIFRQPAPIRAAFLRGLFDADGSVGGHSVHYYSASLDLVKQLKLMLSFWGIRARIQRKTQPQRTIGTSELTGGIPIFHLTINAKDAVLFAEFIGFGCAEKQGKLREIALQQAEMINAMRSRYIPTAPLRREFADLPSGLKIRSRLYEKRRNAFSESNLLCMLRGESTTSRQAEVVEETIDNRFVLCKIESVVWVQESVDVYDFTVARHNNYIVDGVLSHNSMGDEQKEIVRIESFWIDTWLSRQYKGLESRYIIHDATAREVDRDTFFHTRESGGTMISSAYKLCAQLIDDHFPPDEWNIYPFHFSDGDNWSMDDTLLCIDILKNRLLPRVNMFAYGQVESPYGSGQFIKDLREHLGQDERVVTSEIRDKDAIVNSIKDFLGKGKL